jgi:hypothetical protein
LRGVASDARALGNDERVLNHFLRIFSRNPRYGIRECRMKGRCRIKLQCPPWWEFKEPGSPLPDAVRTFRIAANDSAPSRSRRVKSWPSCRCPMERRRYIGPDAGRIATVGCKLLNSPLKKGSDPLAGLFFPVKSEARERVRPLFQRAVKRSMVGGGPRPWSQGREQTALKLSESDFCYATSLRK